MSEALKPLLAALLLGHAVWAQESVTVLRGSGSPEPAQLMSRLMQVASDRAGKATEILYRTLPSNAAVVADITAAAVSEILPSPSIPILPS
ncbi:hypothetical protein HaLaN_05854 [Haematococcus lacustris]|uniref:Uncharacterized protein n=1 Tax=Haematococcus lacustris TaxID=44745 RepID=A0A699YJW0_HAELA|nr:hypothetical protein HaLaN_05854 [Haematococcus lacustris]